MAPEKTVVLLTLRGCCDIINKVFKSVRDIGKIEQKIFGVQVRLYHCFCVFSLAVEQGFFVKFMI